MNTNEMVNAISKILQNMDANYPITNEVLIESMCIVTGTLMMDASATSVTTNKFKISIEESSK
jgi:hypothetical protein